MNAGRHVLVISPVFHHYWSSIERGFASRGHRVTTHCYDDHSGMVAKARNKLLYEGLDRVRHDAGTKHHSEAATTRAREVLRALRPDAVVVVKGDLFGDPFWDELDRSGVPRVLWLYDEIRRTRFDLETLERMPAVASYSPEDVAAMREAGIVAEVVPLAFDPTCTGTVERSDEVVFIGARYPKRSELLVGLHRRGIPIRAVGRDWSPRVVDRLRTWSWQRPDLPATTAVTRERAAGMMAGALATLNIHGDQDGFTMRTFEACGVGALQLIDRDDVGAYYEPGVEVCPFADLDEAAELIERARRDRPWADAIREAGRRRTLAEHTFAHRTFELEQMWA